MWRWTNISLIVSIFALIIISSVIGGGWYLSNLLKEAGLVPNHDEPESYPISVSQIGNGIVTLQRTDETEEEDDWKRGEFWGLENTSGHYDQIGKILKLTDDYVVREFFPVDNLIKPGDKVRLDSFSYPINPEISFGMAFQEISYLSPLGEFPAWLVIGTSDDWVVLVHGKTADRREALRILPTLHELGLNILVITYRNDEGLPNDPDGFYQYGLTEWEDLESAVQYALENGASKLILMGHSMGGAIVTNFLYQSNLENKVTAAILDAPMLDFGATVDLGARERGYPQAVAWIGKLFSKLRFGINWGTLNYLQRTDQLNVPILLFHGDDDHVVPIETSNALSKARPDIVQYIQVQGAGHARSWNTDTNRYQTAVRIFLTNLLQ